MEYSTIQGNDDPQACTNSSTGQDRTGEKLKEHHTVKDNKYNCDNCELGFELVKKLKQHLKICKPVMKGIKKRPRGRPQKVEPEPEPEPEPAPAFDTDIVNSIQQPTGRPLNIQKELESTSETQIASGIKRKRGRPRKVQKEQEPTFETETIGSVKRLRGSMQGVLKEPKMTCVWDRVDSIHQQKKTQKMRKDQTKSTQSIGSVIKKELSADFKIKKLYLKPLVRNNIQCSICPFTSDSITLVTTHFLDKHVQLGSGYNASTTVPIENNNKRWKGLFNTKPHAKTSKPSIMGNLSLMESDIESDMDDSDDYCADPDFAPTKSKSQSKSKIVKKKSAKFSDKGDNCRNFSRVDDTLSQTSNMKCGAIIHKRLPAVAAGNPNSNLMKTITNIKYKYDCFDHRRYLLIAKNRKRPVSTDRHKACPITQMINSGNDKNITEHSEKNHVNGKIGKSKPHNEKAKTSMLTNLKSVLDEVIAKGKVNTINTRANSADNISSRRGYEGNENANKTHENTNNTNDQPDKNVDISVSSGIPKSGLNNINSQIASIENGDSELIHAKSSLPTMSNEGSKEQASTAATSGTSMEQENAQESRPLHCGKCSITFPNITVYVIHRGFHSPGAMFKCSLCMTDLADKEEFGEHISKHKLG